MKIISLEEHYMNKAIAEAGAQAMEAVAPHFKEAWSRVDDPTQADFGDIFDLDERRLAYMDRYGIDMQVLSYNSPGTQLLPRIPLSTWPGDQTTRWPRRSIGTQPDSPPSLIFRPQPLRLQPGN